MTTTPAQPLVLDGAMGTELLRRGYDTGLPLWSAATLLDDPEIVTGIHEDYVGAGADVLTANTFRTNVRAFEKAGLDGAAARAATERALACAREAVERAADRPVRLAGSVAPVEDCYSPRAVPSDRELAREHGLLTRWLVDAGVDVVLVETMNCVREARIAVSSASSLGVPVWASFVTGGAPDRLLSGESLVEGARAAIAAGASLVGVNCVRAERLSIGLQVLSRELGAPLIGFANGGHVEADGGDWHFDEDLDAERYASTGLEWVALGARVVGGCCGTGPALTAALRRGVDKRAAAAYDPGRQRQ